MNRGGDVGMADKLASDAPFLSCITIDRCLAVK